jgi:nucleotide-binding universal stress UspA family protein
VKIETIIAATDFSEIGGRAVGYAIDLARAMKARVVIVHSIEPLTLGAPGGMLVPVAQMTETMVRGAQTALTDLATKLSSSGVAIESMLREGYPADEIVQAAKDAKADLVVIGTHGRRGLSHVLLGSVAERVVRMAPCPVLTTGRG